MEIGQYEMYPNDSKYVEQVLYEMATEPIQFAGKPKIIIKITIPEHYKSITAHVDYNYTERKWKINNAMLNRTKGRRHTIQNDNDIC